MAVNNPEVKVDLISFIYSYIAGQELKLGLSIFFTRSACGDCTICLIPTIVGLRIRTQSDSELQSGRETKQNVNKNVENPIKQGYPTRKESKRDDDVDIESSKSFPSLLNAKVTEICPDLTPL